jgi:hypothetical protein
MGNTGELRALLLTHEEKTMASFHAVCEELGIAAEPVPPANEIALHLDEQKFAAVIVDFDDPDAAEESLLALRQSKINKHAVIVAVVTNTKNLERALKCRAHFVVRRPFEMAELQRTLRSAYDFMLANQRRQFRCSIVLPVRLRMVRSGAVFECSSVNISSNGIAVSGSMRMKQFDSLDLEMVLPDGFVVLATGIVIWEDKQGKCGINFQVRTPEMRQKLDSCLSAHQALATSELTGRDVPEIPPHSHTGIGSSEQRSGA